MAVEVRIPQFGMTMHEATIVSWRKNVGEPVALGEAIAELETDKVTVELEAPASGVIAAIHAKEGQTVAVFELVAVIE